MVVTGDIKKVRAFSKKCREKGRLVGFIPTMGSLHEGHLSLVKRAKEECDFLVVSIFVNSFQFGSKENYRRYPRNIKKDSRLLRAEGINLLFFPQVNVIYPPEFSVYVEETDLSRVLCGKSRSGHFRGVCTILTKLFNIVEPDTAYFGRKDYQQALIAERLARDLNFSIKIRILPIVREKDNLAISSRNVHLKDKERKDSVCLYEALSMARKLIREGERNSKVILNKMQRIIMSRDSAKIDYIEIVNAGNLEKTERIKGKILIVLAVYIKNIRLIDNIIINVK